MKRTAKSLMATLLTLVMLMSSFVFVGISGSAAESVAAQEIKPTTMSEFQNGTDAIGITNGNVTTDSSKNTAFNAFFYNDAFKTICANAKDAPLHLGISFTLEPKGTERLPEFTLRFNGRTTSGGKAQPNFLYFRPGTNAVTAVKDGEEVKICDYVVGETHEIRVDLYITWATASANGTLTTAVFVDGEFLWESAPASHQMAYIKDGTESGPQFFTIGSGLTAGGDVSLNDLTYYINMPKEKPIDARVTFKPELDIVTTDGGYIMSPNGTNSSLLWLNLAHYNYNNVGASQHFGMSFTVDTAGGRVNQNMRFKDGSGNYVFLSFGASGNISTPLDGAVLGSYTDAPVDIKMDIRLCWANADVDNYVGSSVSIDYYVNGVYVHTAEKINFMKRPAADYANTIQFTGTGKLTITNIKSYDTVADGSSCNSFIYSGASMRLDQAGGAESSGLRFVFGVDKTWWESLDAGATVGALIIPTDKLTNGFSAAALAGLTEEVDYIKMTDIRFNESAEEADDNTYVYYASLVNILDQNYARSFTGVGFVELSDGTRIYTATQSRSVHEVASGLVNAGLYEGTENATNKGLLEGYLNKVVTLTTGDGTFAISEITNYTNPYTVEKTADGFVLSGDAAKVANISTVILDGTVYTGGWDKSVSGELRAVIPAAQ